MAKHYQGDLSGICVVEVSGESCANCLTLMPILNRLCADLEGVRLIHVEADYSTMPLMEEWDVEKVPTILVMEDGEIFARCAGFQPEEILEIWLQTKIEERKNAKQ